MINKYNSRIIIACDFSSKEDLYAFLQKMGNKKLFLKLGMQIIYKEGFGIVEEMKKLGHNIFIDLKVHDIPNTIKGAATSLKQYNADFMTLHTTGGKRMMQAAEDAVKGTDIVWLGVTILTSMSHNEWKQISGSSDIEGAVENLMIMAKESGMRAIVCSPREAHIAKKYGLWSITPGVRMTEDSSDDQTRIMTPKEAIQNGSSFIVMGRSLTGSNDPKAKYERVQCEIGECTKC